MKETLRTSTVDTQSTAEHCTVSSNEGGRFAGIARTLTQAVAFAAAMTVPNAANAAAPYHMENGEESFTCEATGQVVYAPKDCPKPSKGKGKKTNPDPTPPPAEDEPTGMRLRTPNISDSTYYTVLSGGAKVPQNSPIDNILLQDVNDTATFYVRGPADLCIDARARVSVVQSGKKGPYEVDDSANYALALSVKQDLGIPPAQTVNADDIRTQPIEKNSVRTITYDDKSTGLRGWTTPMRLDPRDALPVGTDDIRIFEVKPQPVEGAQLAFPMVIRLDACHDSVDLRKVQTPTHVAAYQVPVNPYFKMSEFTVHGLLEPTPDTTTFPSGYKAYAQARNGIVNLPAGTHLDVRRVGDAVVDSFGRPVPDHFVRVTAQYGAPNNEPEQLVLMNGVGNVNPEISQLSGVRATAWSFQTEEMFDPNTCTDTGCTFNFKRAFWPEDHSTGVTRDITATVTFDGGELVRTFDQQPRFVGTKTPTIGTVVVDPKEYNVDPFLVCTGIANTIMCFTQQGAGNETKYQVCGAGVAPEDNGKTRMFHLDCGEDILNQPAPRMLGARE